MVILELFIVGVKWGIRLANGLLDDYVLQVMDIKMSNQMWTHENGVGLTQHGT
jgi:hypothetical protein